VQEEERSEGEKRREVRRRMQTVRGRVVMMQHTDKYCFQ
jgi:hypothetical protein